MILILVVQALVPKVPDTGGQERHPVLVAAVDRVLVAHRAPRMRDALDAGLACLLDAVPPREGEEGVAGQHRALHLLPGLLEGDLHALDAVGLPGAHAQHAPALGHCDGVGLDVLAGPPRELDVRKHLLGGLGLGHARPLDLLGDNVVEVLLQPTVANLAQGAAIGGSRGGLEDAERLALALEDLEALGGVGGRHHDLVEHARLPIRGRAELADLAGEVRVHLVVEGHNAAKRADGVGDHGVAVALELVGGSGHAAGVGVLDDDAGGVHEVAHAVVRRISVEVVVVAHLLAVVLHGRAHAALAHLGQGLVHVEGRALVWVLAVPQPRLELHRHGNGGRGLPAPDLPPHPLGHERVVRSRVLEGLPRQLLAEVLRAAPRRKHAEHLGVVARVHDHEHVLVVLRGGAEHGGPTDVDVLHPLGKGRGGVARDGGAEGVEVHNHEVDQANSMSSDGLEVGGDVAAGEDAAMDARVEGLDPPIEHLWEARDLSHLLAGDSRL
mmetsp:Transcript_69225/g.219017  ORF Transcript_69225/g.219017 Transcript_69225/m.219017 type:complete len:497 (-) Transcript_69225:383-1873(-)